MLIFCIDTYEHNVVAVVKIGAHTRRVLICLWVPIIPNFTVTSVMTTLYNL